MAQVMIAFLLTVFTLVLLPGDAAAVGNIHFGKLEVNPYLSLQEIFDNNIYKTRTQEKRDTITRIMPGAKLQFPFGMHVFDADYHAVLRRYDTYRGENTTDHFAQGGLDLHFGSKLGLMLRDRYAKDHEGRSISATGFIDVVRRNEGTGIVTYQLAGKSKVQVDYKKTSHNFMIANFRDRDEAVIAGYIYYRFLPKTSAFVEFDRKDVNFVPSATLLDNKADYLLLGITWEATAKSKGVIKAGRTKKDFETATVKDFDLWSFYANVDHKFSESTSLNLLGQRDVNETNLFGTAYYVTTGFAADFKHVFGARTAGLARFSYGKDDFSNAVAPSTVTRSDKTTMWGVGFRYSLREWLEFGADTNRRSRDSNIDGADYVDTQYILSVSGVF